MQILLDDGVGYPVRVFDASAFTQEVFMRINVGVIVMVALGSRPQILPHLRHHSRLLPSQFILLLWRLVS